jgi:putative ABC transport system permease protein
VLIPADDLKQAIRTLFKHRGFTAVGALTVALAVAGNTAIFAVVKALVLEPLSYPHPEELVTLDDRSTRGFLVSTSIPNYRDWGSSRAFQAHAAAAGWAMILTGRGQAEVIDMRVVMGDFFGTLGTTPLLGRVLSPAETEPGAEPTVVLGYRFWRERLGGDPRIVGQTLMLDQRPHVVVGVLPEGVGYPSAATASYVPMGSVPGLPVDDRLSGFGTRVLARLAAGVIVAGAQEDLDRITANIQAQVGQPIDHPEVRSLTDFFVHDFRKQVWVLMGAVGLVLLIAVANVGSLVLVRGEDRRREIAVRAALGARRSEIVRLLLTESVLLALLGGALGLGLAYAIVRLMVPLLPASIPLALSGRIAVDAGVLAFTLALATLTGLLFGIVPALRASDLDPALELREGTRGSTGRQRLRSALVVAEVALSLVLLIGAGLLLTSLDRLRRTDKGFDDASVFTARVGLTGPRYESKEGRRAFYHELLTRAAALPGVRSAAVTLLLPLSNRSWEMGVLPDNQPFDPTRLESVLYNIVSEGYFQTLGIPLLKGRTFTASDRDETPLVTVIDETMAQKFWPGEEPIGRRITFEQADNSTPAHPIPLYRTVIGVVKNVRHYELATPSRMQLYVPLDQTLRRSPAGALALKTSVPPMTLLAPLRRELLAMDPDVPLTAAQPLAVYVDDYLAGSHAMSVVVTTFGGVALLLAAVGLFGLTSYTVAQRTREIGIRMALGAEAGEVVGWLARAALGLAVMGVGGGLLGAAALARLIRSLLYEVSPLDPTLYAVPAVVLLGVAALASYLPARRATAIDPAAVLKQEG